MNNLDQICKLLQHLHAHSNMKMIHMQLGSNHTDMFLNQLRSNKHM